MGTIIAKKLGSKSKKLAKPLDQIIANNKATIVNLTSKGERKVANNTPITRTTTSSKSWLVLSLDASLISLSSTA